MWFSNPKTDSVNVAYRTDNQILPLCEQKHYLPFEILNSFTLLQPMPSTMQLALDLMDITQMAPQDGTEYQI